MELPQLIALLEGELSTLDAQRARIVTALDALRADAPPPPAKTAPAVRQARPPVAPDAEDDTARALLKALRALGAPSSTGAIESRAKTGLANISLRRRLMTLVEQVLVTRTGEGAGTRYAATT